VRPIDSAPIRPVAALLLLAAAAHGEGWPTEAHDQRRTGQSGVRGPQFPAAVETVFVLDAHNLNMPPTVTAAGRALVGSWGVVRSGGSWDPFAWTKSDGKLYALDPSLQPAWAAPFAGEPVPYCYSYDGRPQNCWGGVGTANGYNGTVEGTASLSADESVAYVGRGDGKLYAVEVATGAQLWAFPTRNPLDAEDPEGGGEVVAGPLVGLDGTVYIATVDGYGPETNAVYAVSPDGHERWRFPPDSASWPSIFLAAPALSPDGTTLYVASAWPRGLSPAEPTAVLAFDVAAPTGDGEQRLRWAYTPRLAGLPLWTSQLAVGSDGTLYLGGAVPVFGGTLAVALALRDLGGAGVEPAWPLPRVLDGDEAQLVTGLALREESGVTTRVYAAAGSLYDAAERRYPRGGRLHALDPATGADLWPQPFDPEAHGGAGSLGGLALDADGVIYTGVSGEVAGGRVLAIDPDATLRWQLPLAGLLEWGHPVLGPGGELWATDASPGRHCPAAGFPVEWGWCAAFDFTARVVRVRPALFADGFDAGTTARWSETTAAAAAAGARRAR
jgi:outer membrane protein assembly factor BamB